MKSIQNIGIIVITLLCLCACGGGGNDEPEPAGRQYSQSATLESDGSETLVTLSNLTSAIKQVSNTSGWLKVTQETYSSGSPQLKLSAAENPSYEERTCNVTITATSGDSVVLTVTQKGQPVKTGIDDIHNGTSGQPAYSRNR